MIKTLHNADETADYESGYTFIPKLNAYLKKPTSNMCVNMIVNKSNGVNMHYKNIKYLCTVEEDGVMIFTDGHLILEITTDEIKSYSIIKNKRIVKEFNYKFLKRDEVISIVLKEGVVLRNINFIEYKTKDKGDCFYLRQMNSNQTFLISVKDIERVFIEDL